MENDGLVVSVVVPCRNERRFIETFVAALLAQDRGDFSLEIIIVDGCSDDGTRELLEIIALDQQQITVIDNPGRVTSVGLNLGICAARGDVIVRMDVHTRYAHDYVRRCVEVLMETDADNVGGAWHAVGDRYLQQAIAAAFQSPFASGNAACRDPAYSGYVDTVYLGCWRKTTLKKLGGFDEELVRNQDDELNFRIVKSGGKIWQSASIKSWYYPRASFRQLFRQFAQYGYWKVRVIQKHRMPASIRHLVPAIFVGLITVESALAWASELARALLFLTVVAYLGANVIATAMTSVMIGNIRYAPVMPFIFFSYHWSYGYGFLRGIVDFVVFRKGGRASFSQVTR